MKYLLLSIMAFIPTVVLGGEIRIELDQGISISPDSDENYYLYSDYYWVGKNFAGHDQESLFGFNLNGLNVEADEILSVSFYAQVVLRHGDGGLVHIAIGKDNTWSEQTATGNNTGGNYGDIIDTNTLNAKNLNQYVSWNISVEEIKAAIENEYLTVYLFTNTVGSDGTNFHDIASERYFTGTGPYLLIKTVETPVTTPVTTNNSSGTGSLNILFLFIIATVFINRRCITIRSNYCAKMRAARTS